jgi:hypothetical protein
VYFLSGVCGGFSFLSCAIYGSDLGYQSHLTEVNMIIPVRCFTCGKVVGNKWEWYLNLLQVEGMSERFVRVVLFFFGTKCPCVFVDGSHSAAVWFLYCYCIFESNI